MKRKGFTLIELLAVIVILSVITLITVPMITSVIEESKKKALVFSVQGLIESANLYAIENEGVHEFLFDKEHQGSTQSGESLDYKGKIEGEGKLYIDKEGNTSICISNDTYYVYKNYNSEIIIGERSKDNCNIEYDALTNKYVAFLESTGSGSNVYSKDEVNNLVDSLDTKITNNTSEITNLKSNIEELQNNLNNLSSVVNNNKEKIDSLNSKLVNVIVKNIYKETKSYSIVKGVNVVVFDIPQIDGYKPIMYVANAHAWYPNIRPYGNESSLIYDNASNIGVYYYFDADFTLDGGNFSCTVLYITV